MKFLIKKYLQFEKQYGTEDDLKLAKERITRYVTDNEEINNSLNINQAEIDVWIRVFFNKTLFLLCLFLLLSWKKK